MKFFFASFLLDVSNQFTCLWKMGQCSILVAYCNSSWSNFEDWRTVWMRLAKLDMETAINMGVIPTYQGAIPTNLAADRYLFVNIVHHSCCLQITKLDN